MLKIKKKNKSSTSISFKTAKSSFSSSSKSNHNFNCNKINLHWNNNSCYIDSLLVALFHRKNKFIQDNLLKAKIKDYGNFKLKQIALVIQKELNEIFKSISGFKDYGKPKTCSNLRKLLNDYYKLLLTIRPDLQLIGIRDNWITSQNDIFDFMEFLIFIFDFKDTSKIIEEKKINLKSKTTNSLIDNKSIYFTNLLSMVPIEELINNDFLILTDIYPIYKEINILNKNKKLIKFIEIAKADQLFIRIPRNIGRQKIKTKILPPISLQLRENTFKLFLTSIIIHYGTHKTGHYICLFKCKNHLWYEYNDLTPNLVKLIGSFNDIIVNENYISNIVGLIYSR